MRISGAVLSALFLAPVAPASAFQSLEGYFVALQACEAYQSKNKLTNPGNVETEKMRAYVIKGLNKVGGDFYQMQVPDAPVTTDRWVHVRCGVHVVEAGTVVAPDPGGPDVVVTPPTGGESTENLLALSWQPAFCEIRPGKTECKQLNDGLLPVTETQLSIHGLWPQPRSNVYCGVPKVLVDHSKARRWSQLPDVVVDAETREALAVAMPGTASFLDRHEWIKHGTCHKGAGGADEYYDDTLLLVDAINDSSVATFLAEHVGAEVETRDIRARFDEAFGDGAGDRVQFQCQGDGGRVLIQEMRIHLRGVIDPDNTLSDLLLAADPVPAGCRAGTIDPAGLQ
ncbi:MAG: ribonuclease T [Pseudomonadota bacterium]